MIKFTQYLRPDGRKREVTVERPREIEGLANLLIQAGAHFDIEELMNLQVSMTCERGEDVLSIRVCANGPDVPIKIDEMIREAAMQV